MTRLADLKLQIAARLAKPVKSFFTFSFLFLFIFSSTIQQTYALVTQQFHITKLQVFTAEHSSHSHAAPLTLPFHSFPVEEESTSDTNEPEQDSDDDFGISFGILPHQIFHLSLRTGLINKSSTDDRKISGIPYFILFHCWKSFLA